MRHQQPTSLPLCARNITESIVLLDVDGTLHADGARVITEEVRDAVTVLRESNEVYLVSNGTDAAWVASLATSLGVAVAPTGTPAGKPSVRAALGIEREGREVVVVGDKYLTDGLLARNLGARFILTERVRSGNERIAVKIAYVLDRVVSWFL